MTDAGYAKLSYFMFGLALGLLIMAFVVTVFGMRAPTKTPEARDAPGCPLDAVSYDTPKWMLDCVACTKVTDRVSNSSWWVLMSANGNRLVLPIGYGTNVLAAGNAEVGNEG